MNPASSPRHRRVLPRAIGLAGTALMAAALLTWVPQPATGWNQGGAEATLWQLMNGARVNNGRRAVQQHATLVSLARWRSKDMVDRSYFSHEVAGTGHQVYHWYDLNGLRYSWGGENIGWNNGYSDADSPVAIHEGFMNSPGHRANVLEPSFTHGGVGAYAADGVMFLGKLRNPRFYTELFMVAASAPPPPPPPPSSNPAPPPPPSGGGGSGSSRPAAPAPSAAPAASLLRVDKPAAPRASTSLDGATVVAAVERPDTVSAERALTRLQPLDAAAGEPTQVADRAAPMRVQAAAAPNSGMFETVLGSLLGFFL